MFISSKNCCIKIISKSINLKQLKKDLLDNHLLYRFIPDLNFSIKQKQIVLSIENQKKIKINFSLKKPFIYGRYPSDFNSTDIIVLSEYLLERLRQESGICTIHSSAIYKKNKSILFFVNLTGAGKTSLALYLHKKYQYQLFSDEKTLIDIKKIKLVGQTRKIFLPEKTKNNLQSFGLKLPKIINIKKTNSKNCCLLIVPIIIPSATGVTVHQYRPDQLRWHLYEEVSKDIRLINGSIFNFSYPLQSLDNHQLAVSRQYFVKIISQQIPCYCIFGTLPDVAKKINQIFLNICRKS